MSGHKEQQNYLAFFIWTLNSDCVEQILEYGAVCWNRSMNSQNAIWVESI